MNQKTLTQASRNLPGGYSLSWQVYFLDIHRLVLVLNLVSIPLLALFGWVFYFALVRLRPGADLFRPLVTGTFWLAVKYIGVYALTILLHELVHGLAFQAVTGAAPKYGFRWFYAFAAAPDFFIRRNRYLAVGLAPLIALSALGLLTAPWTPPGWLGWSWFAMTVNAAGAVGDLYVTGRLLLKGKPDALVQDEGDRIRVFVPASPGGKLPF